MSASYLETNAGLLEASTTTLNNPLDDLQMVQIVFANSIAAQFPKFATAVRASVTGKWVVSRRPEGVPCSMSAFSAEWTICFNSGMLGAGTPDAKALLVPVVTSFPKRS